MIFLAAAIIAIFGYALYGLTAGGVHLPADPAALVVIGTIVGALCAALFGSLISARPVLPIIPPLVPPGPGTGPGPGPGTGPGLGPGPILPPPEPRKPRNRAIIASSFNDAIGDHDNPLDPYAKPSCALPKKFTGTRPVIRAFYPAGVWPPEHTADIPVEDLGPWYPPEDEYWPGNRPRAEQNVPPTNGAGIDLTPAAWAALGFKGNLDLILEKIDWDFVDYLDAAVAPGPGPGPGPGPAPGPTPLLGGIVDTNEDTTSHLSALKAEHVGTVIRYVARSQAASRSKTLITPAEARAIAAAGMNLGLVFETDGHPSGAVTGDTDGHAALATASQVGAPQGACIYYAVDYDAPQADMPGIVAAFSAFKAVVSPTYVVGCYGSGAVNSQLLAAGLIRYRWITQSASFAGSKAAVAVGQYELLQHLPQTVGGLDCDPNTPREPNLDIGVFVPFGTRPTAPTLPPPAPVIDTRPDGVPPWLLTMQQITGTHEVAGSGDNPVILSWATVIARKFPDMAAYCARYNHDSIAWCGLTVAYGMAMAGIRPPFVPGDDERCFLWADSWRQFGTAADTPQPGDVLVFQWANGGHHVTLYDHETDGDQYACRGGNQADAVSVAMLPMSACTAIRRPVLPAAS